MSVNSHYRNAWVKVVVAEAVTLFHAARKNPENADLSFTDLARQCANTVFADKAGTIVGDKETCARAFMQACRERFPDEIQKALVELPEPEVAVSQSN